MEYNEILDIESKKLLGLFNALRSTNNSKSLDTLSKELGINSKTIMRAIKKLKKLFKHYQLDHQLAIGCRDRNQFYLKRQDDQYLEFFLVQYLSDLPEIIFLKTIIEEKNVTTKQLIDSMLVSESSLRRRAKKINCWLKKFDLHLKRGSWELVGEEEQIRALVLPFYWFAYQKTKSHFWVSTIENSREFAIKFISFFNIMICQIKLE
ncbi:helix-turn-helix domain-containing protein [Enterococcus rotai]|uniref:helix-turn-helix domain-containing protein n=1 Tax=Enterococcus rotai TaxID=118060 RepID=UPI0035C66A61